MLPSPGSTALLAAGGAVATLKPSGGCRSEAVSRRFYSAELLEAVAAGGHAAFVRDGGRSLRPRLARALALADLRPGLAVVDIGCGRGEAAVHAARRGALVTALDFSPGALDLTRFTVARVLADPSVRLRVHLLASEASALPLADRCADRVLLLDVVEHLHSRQLALALAEVGRILRPGGFVVIHTLPNRWALAITYPLLRALAPGLPAEPRSGYERAVHVNEQDPFSLRRAISAAGLDSRIWVEEWSTRHAAWGRVRNFPDAVRTNGYPLLRRPAARRLARLIMLTPLRWVVANDLFALAWPKGACGPPNAAR